MVLYVCVAVGYVCGAVDEFSPLSFLCGVRQVGAKRFENLFEGRDLQRVEVFPPGLRAVWEGFAYGLVGEDAGEELDGEVGELEWAFPPVAS